MKLSDVTPMPNTLDLPGTIRFYEEVPGFTCIGALRDPNGYLLQFGTETECGQGAPSPLP